MPSLSSSTTRFLQTFAIVLIALVVYLGLSLFTGQRTVHALPEYAARTGEPCATCHVSAGGGGPRTLRGLLWAARGRPDQVPELPGLLLAPDVDDGAELYDIACAGCHGFNGEGLYGIRLTERRVSRPAVRSFIQRGIPELGMPAFDGQFTAEQLEALSQFVAELSAGEGPPSEYPLPPPELNCAVLSTTSCGGQ
jgi:mono/diheme cytochrome c family protein